MLFFLSVSISMNAQPYSALLRFPTVSQTHVVFSYAGDLYSVPRSGGVAHRLTAHPGNEIFARFSPDGKSLAFSGQYDGNTEVYEMPAQGGTPKRLTITTTLGRDDLSDRMGPNNIVMTWTPDGKSVVYRSRQYSFNDFKGQLFQVDKAGGMSTQLPFSVASWCSYNTDGSKLAYNRVFREFRTWKYYRGGMADDVWVIDLKSGATENITNNEAQDIFPMWHGNKVYFTSDRDRTMNLYVYDPSNRETRKLTHFNDYDVKWPSLGPDAIVFEKGGKIFLFDLQTEKTTEINIQLNGDYDAALRKFVNAADFIGNYDISPDGSRLSFSARGEIFTVPAKEGITRRITHSSGAHDRDVCWSPDGKWLAWISDESGEDEIWIQKQDGSEPKKQLTKNGTTYKYSPVWSPDSKSLLYADRSMGLFCIELESGATRIIDRSPNWEIRSYSWSPDSKWILFTYPGGKRPSVIKTYSIDQKKTFTLTDGWYQASSAVFSPDGKYVYFVSNRDFNPTYSATEWNHAYTDMSRIYLINLQASNPSPFRLKNDEVSVPAGEEKKDTPKTGTSASTVTIDFEGMAQRTEVLPVPAGNYWSLQAVNGGVYYGYRSQGNKAKLKFFDLSDEKEKEIMDWAPNIISANQKKILVQQNGSYYVEDLPKAALKTENKADLSQLKIWVDLAAEWNQIYTESWRQMRDFFYDPAMHGVNWQAIRQKYAALLPYVRHRDDLNYLIGEMIGELNAGHAYVNGGDRTSAERINLGLLGARFSKHKDGYFRIDKVLQGANWSNTLRSPLAAPGVNAREGEFIVAVNGQDAKNITDLNQLLIGKANAIVELSISSDASGSNPRKVLVKPIKDESELYYHEWVENNRKKVEEASGGKIGYLHIPDMSPEGLNQFARYFYAQLDKEALIIDDRGNGGGNVSPMIIERLRREIAFGTSWRNATEAGTKPGELIAGPKICLIDQYSASDGDLFPYQFRFYKLGPLLGQRTWGGVVGIRGSLPFIDGGDLRKPEFGHFSHAEGKWVIEGEGVTPDVEVINDPWQEYKGVDAQLNKAIELMLEELKNRKPVNKTIPAFPDKSK